MAKIETRKNITPKRYRIVRIPRFAKPRIAMHIHPLFLIVLSSTLTSCTSVPKNAITLDRYSELDRSPKLVARQFRISCSIVDAKGAVTQFPILIVEPSEQISVETTKELIYPTKFDLPRTTSRGSEGSGRAFPITPTTPTAFESRELGDRLSLTARSRGPFVEISGALITETFTLSSRGAGEALSPITDSKRRFLFTENKVTLPQIKRIETLIHVVGLPATAHTIHLEAQNSNLIITCEVIK
jgi:hypothetical protein